MKKLTYTLLMIGLMLSVQSLQAQCPLYQTYINKGNQLLQADKLTEALNAYLAAQIHCPSRAEEAQKKIKLVFDRINQQKAEIEQKKNEIEKQRDKIKEEQEKTQKAFNKIEAQKETIQKEQENTQKALDEAQANLRKATEMQTKMETAVFDKAVKEQIPEWKGYNNTDGDKKTKLLTQIDSLDLSQNALVSIPKKLQECPNLRHINLLGNNDIVWDSLAIIKDLPKLQSIYVSVNDLSDIDSTYWKKITGIEILQDGLQEIPQNILDQKQLVYLDLTGGGNLFGNNNKIYHLPSQLFNLKNLEYLNLSSCSVEILPKEINQLNKLKRLSLQSNQLSGLPKEIGELQNLINLDLSQNLLNSLPKEVGKLQNLKHLYLSNNYFKSLPMEVMLLKNVEILFLMSNDIYILPKEIGKLQDLQELDLDNNYLRTLPKEIGNLVKLKKLDVSENQLSHLPKEIGKLQSLETLNLGGVIMATRLNQLETLPKEIGELKKLKYLDLSGNKLDNLPAGVLRLKNLKSLDLMLTRLIDLPSNIKQLESLEYLSLEANPIRVKEQEKIKKLLPNCKIEFSEFDYVLLLWVYLQQNILEEKINEFREVKEIDLGNLGLELKDLKKASKLLNWCDIQVTPPFSNEIDRFYSRSQYLYVGPGKFHTIYTKSQSEKDSVLRESKKQLALANWVYEQKPDIEENIIWLIRSQANLALNFQHTEQSDSAIYYFQQAMKEEKKLFKVNPNSENHVKIYYDDFIKIFKDKKDYQSAIKYQEKYLEYALTESDSSDLKNIYSKLAYMFLYNQQYQKAEESARKSLEINPDKNYAHLSLARALLLQGRFEEAKKIFVEKKGFQLSDDENGKQASIRQLKKMKKAGVIPQERMEDVEKIIKLLEE